MTDNRSSADPVLTANLYARGRLDAVIAEVIAPLRRAMGEAGWLWFLRYPKGGEHLKLRGYAEAPQVPTLRHELAARFARFAEDGKGTDTPGPAVGRSLPAIDLEDDVESPYPNLTLRWTEYRPSAVSLGGGPLLEDATYRELFGRAAASCCERLVGLMAAPRSGLLTAGGRLRILVEIVSTSLAGLGWSRERLAAYFSYHRDWIIRLPLLGRRQAGNSIARLEERARTSAISGSLMAGLRVSEEEARPLVNFVDYLRRFEGDPVYVIDPFAEGPVFPALFKVLHGVSNACGLRMTQERFAYHLLLRGEDRVAALRPVTLRPSAG
ncbi:MAG: lantibiotic dehydratase C-terminal domain-containing protein [Acidobacteriota bacterium]